MQISPGKPYPLGATWQGDGVNFALYSKHATRVELSLFDSQNATKESTCVPLPFKTHDVWHGFIPNLRPGQIYGYRVYGEYAPHHGQRFNPHKVMLDPYARALARNVRWSDSMFGYRLGDPSGDLSFDNRDNAADCCLGTVIDNTFRWGGDKLLRTPWNKTLIYEMHVKGMTYLHPLVPSHLRGTYAGLASKPVIQHLLNLGITAIQLMPVHHKLDDRFLVNKSLTNYWGYNTLSFFAPESSYASAKDPQEIVSEFKRMVKRYHQAGIEVLMDVVYNHTAEGNELGPSLSMRGIDNATYYRMVPGNERYYRDYTGCGNTLNTQNSQVLKLIMDSLRYWVQEMHIDGFRFDLTSALGREAHDYDPNGSFFDNIHQDPILSTVKMIAEPWDIGEGGYQVGNYPIIWSEWNGRYRDCIRSFWRGDGGTMSEFATRITGSSDIYQYSGRKNHASINFITSHDGFSMQDLVSYQSKHNEANGEENRDGDNHNTSWNCGEEGATNDPQVESIRERQKRNFMATLLLSQGVPMMRMGDEFSHTQKGNNNAYCQDNPISWINWQLTPAKQEFFNYVCKTVKLWRENPIFQKNNFFQGIKVRGSNEFDVTWLTPQGKMMSMEDWNSSPSNCLGVRLEGEMPDEIDEKCQPVIAKTFVMLFNARNESVRFVLPQTNDNQFWRPEIDSSGKYPEDHWLKGGIGYPLEAHSMAVLRLKTVRSKIGTKLIGWLKRKEVDLSKAPAAAPVENGAVKVPEPALESFIGVPDIPAVEPIKAPDTKTPEPKVIEPVGTSDNAKLDVEASPDSVDDEKQLAKTSDIS
jgi:glycogen operon protein